MHFKELWNHCWLCLCNDITNLDAANLKVNFFIYSALEAKPLNVHVQLLINCSGFCPNNGVGVWLQDFVPIIGGGLTVSQVFIHRDYGHRAHCSWDMWFITPIRERFSVLLRWIPRTMYSHKRMRSYKLKMGRLAGNKKQIFCKKNYRFNLIFWKVLIGESGIICKSLIQEKLFSTAIIWTSDLLARGWENKKGSCNSVCHWCSV